MGCRFSCNAPPSFDCVRVVHMDGYVEDFPEPTTVGQVTLNLPNIALCSSLQLVTFNSKPLRSDDVLEPGRLYFLLPSSVFQSDSSPAVMVSLVARLTAYAKKRRPVVAGARNSGDTPLSGQKSAVSGAVSSSGRVLPCRSRLWRPMLDPIMENSREGSLSCWSSGRS